VAAKDATIADLKRQNAQLEASHARTVAAKDAAFAKLERDHAASRADAAVQLAAVHAVVTSELSLEIHSVRRDRRQFATLPPYRLTGSIPRGAPPLAATSGRSIPTP
jgi:ethanolamine ammonia-lyase small subunit